MTEVQWQLRMCYCYLFRVILFLENGVNLIFAISSEARNLSLSRLRPSDFSLTLGMAKSLNLD